MRILLTGAAGFIGSNLLDKLLLDEHEVVGLDNFDSFYDPFIKQQNIKSALSYSKFELVEGDIRDSKLLKKVFSKTRFDCVIHLAARAGVRPSIEDPLLYQDVNVCGTNKLLEAMRGSGHDRLVFASSSSVYGNNKKVPFSESDSVDFPISPYAASKKAGELLCYTYWHLFKIRSCCLRFFTVYGPRQRPEMAIHKFTRMINAGTAIPFFGDGSSCRDYTYVADIVQGIDSILNGSFNYDIVNLGESETTKLSELVSLIEKSLGKTAILERHDLQAGDVDQTFADLSHAKSLFDYKPLTKVVDGIPKFVEWYLKQHTSI
jgi:UDP-glucuronate 4-epimerase